MNEKEEIVGENYELISWSWVSNPVNPHTVPNFDIKCEVCGEVPTVAATRMCGPCTFGEAETADGNW